MSAAVMTPSVDNQRSENDTGGGSARTSLHKSISQLKMTPLLATAVSIFREEINRSRTCSGIVRDVPSLTSDGAQETARQYTLQHSGSIDSCVSAFLSDKDGYSDHDLENTTSAARNSSALRCQDLGSCARNRENLPMDDDEEGVSDEGISSTRLARAEDTFDDCQPSLRDVLSAAFGSDTRSHARGKSSTLDAANFTLVTLDTSQEIVVRPSVETIVSDDHLESICERENSECSHDTTESSQLRALDDSDHHNKPDAHQDQDQDECSEYFCEGDDEEEMGSIQNSGRNSLLCNSDEECDVTDLSNASPHAPVGKDPESEPLVIGSLKLPPLLSPRDPMAGALAKDAIKPEVSTSSFADRIKGQLGETGR